MLTPEQIEALRDKAGHITDSITNYLLEDIARRVSEAGQLTSTAAYQVWRAQNLGLSQKEVKERLKKLLKASNKEIKQLMTQAAEVGYRFDLERLPTSAAIPFEENGSLQQIVSAAVELAQEDFTNLTQTLGMVDPFGNALPLQDVYRSCTDFAFEQVITGATDYNTAIRQACKNLADQNVLFIDYESDVRTSLEAAVRRNIMGGLGLMQEKISQANHDSLGCDGWEISAHANSAPDHEDYQGKQYTDKEYEDLNNNLKRRIGTLNCGHAAFPIIMGVSEPQYTKEQLEKFRQDNKKGITYEGKHYTGYEATQMQRKIERAIRTQKRRVLLDEKNGDTDKLAIDQTKLVRLQQEYSRFSKAAGLRTESERAMVAGFGRSEAARVTAAGKKQVALIDSFSKAMADNGYITKGFDYYTGDAETLNQMQTVFAHMAKEYPDGANGLTVRLSRTKDPATIGWYDNKTRTIHYNQAFFKSWGQVQNDYAALVKAGHFPVGTDARGCFYHEFGHAVWGARNLGSLRKPVDNVLKKYGYGYLNASQREMAIRKELSLYAITQTNPAYQEVIAEAFNEWYTSSEPRRFCQDFLKEVGVL